MYFGRYKFTEYNIQNNFKNYTWNMFKNIFVPEGKHCTMMHHNNGDLAMAKR